MTDIPTTTHVSLRSRRRRNLLLAILLPVAMMAMLLGGVGTANASDDRLPALIVNDDQMVTQANADGTTTPVVGGRLFVSWLTNPANSGGFDWQLASADSAQTALNTGQAYVVVTVPSDFSASIVSLGSGSPHRSTIGIVTDQSHDYLSGELASRVMTGMVATFGATITQQVVVGLAEGVGESAQGLRQAAEGAAQLGDGAEQLGEGFGQYADGVTQLSDGAASAAGGASELGSGATQLSDGATQLSSGASTYSAGVAQYVDGAAALADGLAQLNQGSPQLREAATALSGLSTQLESVPLDQIVQGLQALRDGLSQLSGIGEATAQLRASCELIPDPAASATCLATVDQIDSAIAGSGLDLTTLIANLDTAIAQLGSAGDGLGQLGQLGTGLTAYVDGVDALTGAASLIAGNGSALVDGADQLATGAQQLASGTDQFATGADQLADGIDQLATGASQLQAGSTPLRDGISTLSEGAGTMAQSLNDGADQAESAMGDPQALADAVATPVDSTVENQRSLSPAGLVGALAVPVGIWIAGLVTMLRRRLITPDLLASSASNRVLLLAAQRRMFVPVTAVAVAVSLLVHLFGAPWAGILATFAYAALSVTAVSLIHLLFVALWGRRGGGVASIALLGVQLIVTRGLVPMQLRPAWVDAIANLLPIPQAVNGLQAAYAGGTPASWIWPAVVVAVIAGIAAACAAIVVGRRRRESAALQLGIAPGSPAV